jgi:hypothetical protein
MTQAGCLWTKLSPQTTIKCLPWPSKALHQAPRTESLPLCSMSVSERILADPNDENVVRVNDRSGKSDDPHHYPADGPVIIPPWSAAARA